MNSARQADWFTLDGRKPVTFHQQLGAGGQGEVHRVEVEGRPLALKRYHPHAATRSQRLLIERLIQSGPPAPYFLWPLRMVESSNEGAFGYVMELREPRFRPFEDFMARRVVTTFRALLTAGLQLSEGFFQLHTKGLCYRDISFGNVFLDPATGDIRICDNDNVDVTGAGKGGVMGTPRFMAPEVVCEEAAASADTDRYSLAVLLFYMLMGGHPLDGAREANIRCLDMPAMRKLYGTEPLYIFDPTDGSNQPVPGIHDNPRLFHPIYPEGLRRLFLQSFTEGLHNPHRRVMESQWRKEFIRARDSLLYCQGCRAHNFYDATALQEGRSPTCWKCHRPFQLPPRIRIESTTENAVIMLNHDTRLFSHHLRQDFDFDTPVAEVFQRPEDSRQWGLRNLSEEHWTLARPDGTLVEVAPRSSAPIVSGNVIQFGPVKGQIRG
jgi:DNA-binding helix-hairpin-helix protein with protein kinase domain